METLTTITSIPKKLQRKHAGQQYKMATLLPLADDISTIVTRGYTLKQKKRDCRTSVRQNFFSYRIVNSWNSLPDSVVSAPSVNCFKHRFDAHCVNLKFSSMWTGSRSVDRLVANKWLKKMMMRRWKCNSIKIIQHVYICIHCRYNITVIKVS